MQLSQITKVALSEAKKAAKKREVPVGAVVFNENDIISKAHNIIFLNNNPLGHAEILALQKAAKKLKTNNLISYNLYVTLEPCIICSYVISKFKIGNLYFGAYDIKNGSVQNGARVFLNSKNIYKPEVYGGIGEKKSQDLLKVFFKDLRKKS
ncbi:MAG: tRNA-specific adenosine deaminase [Alphaproteobacteria bacterium MarineAlpha9_Bin4]|nr:MAG: tRNA-specific adenosine deaminase [Alphaproteobacteria bacterium MarineAlpha9_Bin4]